MGYHRAGFDVTGVDIKPQKRYPFPFIQGDALEYVRDHWQEYDAVHASPPCQAYSMLRALRPEKEYSDLVVPTRAALQATGLPYIIENVPGAPLIEPALVCGSSLGLQVRRHRLFESNVLLIAPPCAHRRQGKAVGVYGKGGGSGGAKGHNAVSALEAQIAMDMGWGTRQELSQAVPPAYTELLGKQLILYCQTASYGT